MSIDSEIAKLEKRLAELKAIKVQSDDIWGKTGDFTIEVWNEKCDEVIKSLHTFRELYIFWKSKMKKTDYIYLEYFRYDKNGKSGRYIEREARSEYEFLEIVKEISTLSAGTLVSMDFTICSKLGNFKYMANIKNEYLDIFYKIDCEVVPDAIKYFFKSEEEYWNKIDEGKNYRLKFN